MRAKPTPTAVRKEFRDNEIIISKTDLKGKITYGNRIFIELSGYEESELYMAPHNIIRHPDMPKIVFKTLWDGVQAGREVPAYVKNMSKDGGFYWVLAFVTPSFNENGKIIGYHSMRIKPKESAIEIIKPLYANLLLLEKQGGIEASSATLAEILKKEGKSYEEFILSI